MVDGDEALAEGIVVAEGSVDLVGPVDLVGLATVEGLVVGSKAGLDAFRRTKTQISNYWYHLVLRGRLLALTIR